MTDDEVVLDDRSIERMTDMGKIEIIALPVEKEDSENDQTFEILGDDAQRHGG